MMSEPVNFGIRLPEPAYWSWRYVFSMMDNGSEKRTRIPPVVFYATTLKALCIVLKHSTNDTLAPRDKPRTWCALLKTRPALAETAPEGRPVIKQNFYTWHNLAARVRKIADSKISLLSTICLNILNKGDKIIVDENMKQLNSST